MDGYTKEAIREALAKRTPRQVKCDAFMDRVINGPMVYVLTALFYGFWGWVIWESVWG